MAENTQITTLDGSTGVSIHMSYDYDKALSQMTAEDKKHYLTLTKDINVNNPHTIQAYGQDVNKIIARQADDLLEKASANRTTDIVVLTNQLLSEINDIETPQEQASTKSWLRSLPFVGRLVKAHENHVITHNSIGKNVAEISKKIESLKVIAMADNASLDQMSENTEEYIKEIRERIIALKVLEEGVKADIAVLESNVDANLDVLQDQRNAAMALSKRITDMSMTEFILQQNLHQIAAMEGNNDAIINKAEMTVGQVIPIWKQQLAIGTIMDDQKVSAEIEQKMADATNQMILKNAHNLHCNSVMLAQANEDAIFRVETLKDTTHTLIQTIKDVQSIHANGEEKRNEILREMKTLGEELADVIRNTKVN